MPGKFVKPWRIPAGAAALPDSLEANRGLVLSYLQAGALREAAEAGTQAVARWPNDPQLLHWLGLAYFKAGQNAQAQELLEKSAKLESNHADVHFDLALVLLAQEQYAPAAAGTRASDQTRFLECIGACAARAGVPEYKSYLAGN